MHYKKTLISLICLLFTVVTTAQDVKDMTFKERLFFGGDLGLTFGTATYINIAPIVGYRITNRLSAGLGPIYIFESYRYYGLRTSTYGGKGFISFTVIKDLGQYINIGLGNIILHCENEFLNIEKLGWDDTRNKIYSENERLWIDNLLIGGGLNQPFGENSGVNIYILWDVTQNKYSSHSNPIIRFGFYF
jgi:hypothetical protein